MDIELAKYFATLGVGGIIAAIMFIFYRKDAKNWTDQWKGQTDMLMKVVQSNTEAITSNTEVVRAFNNKVGNDDSFRATHKHVRAGD